MNQLPLIPAKKEPTPSGFKKVVDQMSQIPEKESEMSIDEKPEIKKRKSRVQVSRRESLLFDDQAINMYRRRGSRVSELSKISRRKSEDNIHVPLLEHPLHDSSFHLDEVISLLPRKRFWLKILGSS